MIVLGWWVWFVPLIGVFFSDGGHQWLLGGTGFGV